MVNDKVEKVNTTFKNIFTIFSTKRFGFSTQHRNAFTINHQVQIRKGGLVTAIRCRRATHGSVSRVNIINRNAYGSTCFVCEKEN